MKPLVTLVVFSVLVVGGIYLAGAISVQSDSAAAALSISPADDPAAADGGLHDARLVPRHQLGNEEAELGNEEAGPASTAKMKPASASATDREKPEPRFPDATRVAAERHSAADPQ